MIDIGGLIQSVACFALIMAMVWIFWNMDGR
jgi:hypothetical protein